MTFNASIHRYAGAIVAELTVFICFLESYQRLQNVQLKIAITTFLVFSILVNLFFLIGTALLMHQNYTASPPLFVVGSISWVICWLGVTFTTSYRASLIVFVGGRRPWLLPLILILCQGALSFTGSAYFTINFISSFGKTVDERSTIITIVESIWYSVMESLLFVITQYRIVSVRSSVKKVPLAVQAQLYMKGILRSALYSLNVIMMFISVGNGFGVGVGGNWSVYGHAITLLILMTDSNRFQETIAILNGDHQPRRTGVPTTGQTLSHQETSVHGHTFSDKGNDHHHNSKEQIPRKSAVAHH